MACWVCSLVLRFARRSGGQGQWFLRCASRVNRGAKGGAKNARQGGGGPLAGSSWPCCRLPSLLAPAGARCPARGRPCPLPPSLARAASLPCPFARGRPGPCWFPFAGALVFFVVFRVFSCFFLCFRVYCVCGSLFFLSCPGGVLCLVLLLLSPLFCPPLVVPLALPVSLAAGLFPASRLSAPLPPLLLLAAWRLRPACWRFPLLAVRSLSWPSGRSLPGLRWRLRLRPSFRRGRGSALGGGRFRPRRFRRRRWRRRARFRLVRRFRARGRSWWPGRSPASSRGLVSPLGGAGWPGLAFSLALPAGVSALPGGRFPVSCWWPGSPVSAGPPASPPVLPGLSGSPSGLRLALGLSLGFGRSRSPCGAVVVVAWRLLALRCRRRSFAPCRALRGSGVLLPCFGAPAPFWCGRAASGGSRWGRRRWRPPAAGGVLRFARAAAWRRCAGVPRGAGRVRCGFFAGYWVRAGFRCRGALLRCGCSRVPGSAWPAVPRCVRAALGRYGVGGRGRASRLRAGGFPRPPVSGWPGPVALVARVFSWPRFRFLGLGGPGRWRRAAGRGFPPRRRGAAGMGFLVCCPRRPIRRRFPSFC